MNNACQDLWLVIFSFLTWQEHFELITTCRRWKSVKCHVWKITSLVFLTRYNQMQSTTSSVGVRRKNEIRRKQVDRSKEDKGNGGHDELVVWIHQCCVNPRRIFYVIENLFRMRVGRNLFRAISHDQEDISNEKSSNCPSEHQKGESITH